MQGICIHVMQTPPLMLAVVAGEVGVVGAEVVVPAIVVVVVL